MCVRVNKKYNIYVRLRELSHDKTKQSLANKKEKYNSLFPII